MGSGLGLGLGLGYGQFGEMSHLGLALDEPLHSDWLLISRGILG